MLRLLERDPYDEDAWTALIAAQVRMRRHGGASHQYAAYTARAVGAMAAARPAKPTGRQVLPSTSK
jgi:DNA-binding SARP family transcriptional activator